MADTAEGGLRLYVLRGESAIHNVTSGRGLAPVVEVRGASDQPIEGAEVRFELPETGPSGTFEDGTRVFITKTNLHGQAAARFIPNRELGDYYITVSATSGSLAGNVRVRQINSDRISNPQELVARRRDRSFFSGWKLWAVLGGASAAGIAAALLAGGDSSETSVGPVTTITPGGPSVGGPR